MSDPPPSSRSMTGKILVADDEPEPLRATARILRHVGYSVHTVESGEAAAEAIEGGDFDVVVSDISMPRMDGIQLLQFMRKHDSDVPVILVTGAPAVETAVQALDHGAYKYLVKPVSPERLEEVVKKAARMRQMARFRRQAAELVGTDPGEELQQSFSAAMDGLWMAYQPIVRANGALFGHEALLRTTEKSLPHPGAILDAAQRLGRMHELGRRVREAAAQPVIDRPESGVLFVNLHPAELEDEMLIAGDSKLAEIASSVVLEITERASVNSIPELRAKVVRLREIGYRIAVDDLGAGYAGLTSFALLEPEIVKLDMTLVRDVHTQPVKQRLIASISSLCREMDIMVVGEGVETLAERDMLVTLGCDLFQGYLVARPGPPFPAITW